MKTRKSNHRVCHSWFDDGARAAHIGLPHCLRPGSRAPAVNPVGTRCCASKPTSRSAPPGLWEVVFACLLMTRLVSAAEIDTNALPPVASGSVVFDRDIRPILEQSCLRCHGPEKPKSHFRLTTREWALKGGVNNNDDIVPGDSAHSRLIQYVSWLVPDMEMPPPGKAPPVTSTQIGLLRAWIDQGANWTAGGAAPQIALSVSP